MFLGGVFYKYPKILLGSDRVVFSYNLADFCLAILSILDRGVLKSPT